MGVEDQTASVKHLNSVVQEDEKQMIIKLFCEWIASLVIFLYEHIKVHRSNMKPKRLINPLSQGGETSDLTESTILDLFKSDYEKKPSLTLPIKKTRPNQTPAKLSSAVEGHHKDAKELNQVVENVLVLNV